MNFENIKSLIEQDLVKSSIGTKQERTLHQYLKYYFCPDSNFHEQKCNNYIVDILKEDRIIEIQTTSFNTMRKKLENLLPLYPITIVYPIIAEKIIHNFNEEGELINIKKSPKKDHPLKIGKELYKINHILNNNNLNFICVILKIDEYRIPYINRRKQKKMTRINQIPLELIDMITLDNYQDFQNLVPYEEFDATMFKKLTKLSPRDNASCLLALRQIGAITVSKKEGKKYIYIKC